MTRFAPSPTGALHLGNLRTFVLNWTLARQRGWRIGMRMEDLDGPRVKSGAEDSILQILDWIGLDWDGPVTRQSDDLEPYRHAMQRLTERRIVYPCRLSRTEIARAATAPHGDEHEQRYPPHLRPADRPAEFHDEETNWRFVTPEQEITFHDAFHGPVRVNPGATVGDFVVWTRRAQPAYQLAVVVDDARQGVTEVVRGDDLLDSTGRQRLLIDALDLKPRPNYTHLPLVLGPDGRRLAKRHGDTRIASYRDAGVPRERLLGLIACWSGTLDKRESADLDHFLNRFDPANLPRQPIAFTQQDDRWLRTGAT